jgi:hypothetical protein
MTRLLANFRVIVTLGVPAWLNFLYFNIQSTGQKTGVYGKNCLKLNISEGGYQKYRGRGH